MKEQQTILSEQKINGLALLEDDSLIYICDRKLIFRSKDTEMETVFTTLPAYIDAETVLHIKVSADERFIVAYTANACNGFVFDRRKEAVTMHLQRGGYQVRHCIFPIALFEQNGINYLVHATDWNVVHITDLETGKRITERVQIAYDDEAPENKGKYLDYFHSLLHISPDRQWIISNGWVWGPGAFLRIWNLQNWLHNNPYEVEKRERCMEYIGGYSWNRPLCWINDKEYLFYHNSGEDEDYNQEGMEPQKGYLLIFNVQEQKYGRYIPFEGFQHNEYWECLDGAVLFYNEGTIISSCPERGISVIALDTGHVLDCLPGATLDQFHQRSKTGASVSGSRITLYLFT